MKVTELVKEYDKLRTSSLNMIASENTLSENVKLALSIQHSRYHAEFYGGSSLFRDIYSETIDLAKKIFNCKSAFISPLSGNLAVLASLFAFSEPKDKVAILPLSPGGGYPINLEYFHRKRVNLSFDEDNFNIDLEKTLLTLKKEKPSLVFLGASIILFPQPIAEIAEVVHDYGGTVAYDGSHVLGLIAGGAFQDPLREGADILLGSTHKSFPGPQGGIILSNEYHDSAIEKAVGINPLEGIVLIDNVHNSRISALGTALEEFQHYGADYAHQVVKNSKKLAESLHSNDVPLLGESNGFSESHQVLAKLNEPQEGVELRDTLLNFKIVTDELLRFGTSELTHLGFKEKNIDELGNLISEIINGYRQNPGILKERQDQLQTKAQSLLEELRLSRPYFSQLD
ncbi:MAG: serine hydroxymethyltransferase [Candidatus Hodarchaeales archaeon]